MNLEIKDVSLNLGGKQILKSVSLSFQPGCVTALLGPNGAGKSTLFSVIAGDIKPNTGKVCYAGKNIYTMSIKEKAAWRAVFMQKSEISYGYSVREVVAMSRLLRDGSPEKDKRLIDTVMRRTGVLEFAAQDARCLSGGQQARVTMARVLAQDTPFLLLDEPAAALDLHYQAELLRICREEAHAGKTVVIILHDLNLACGFADEIVLMQAGTVVRHGAPEAIAESAQLERVYGERVTITHHPQSRLPVVLLADSRDTSYHGDALPQPMPHQQIHQQSATDQIDKQTEGQQQRL